MNTIEMITAGVALVAPVVGGLVKAVSMLRQVLKELQGEKYEPSIRDMVCSLDGRVKKVEGALVTANIRLNNLETA